MRGATPLAVHNLVVVLRICDIRRLHGSGPVSRGDDGEEAGTRGALERYARGAPLRAHADRRGTPAEPRKTRTVPNEYLEPLRLSGLSTRSRHYGPGVYRIGDGEAITAGHSVCGALRAGGGRDTRPRSGPRSRPVPGPRRGRPGGGLRRPVEARTGPVRARGRDACATPCPSVLPRPSPPPTLFFARPATPRSAGHEGRRKTGN